MNGAVCGVTLNLKEVKIIDLKNNNSNQAKLIKHSKSLPNKIPTINQQIIFLSNFHQFSMYK